MMVLVVKLEKLLTRIVIIVQVKQLTKILMVIVIMVQREE